jgi:hypothetical protein
LQLYLLGFIHLIVQVFRFYVLSINLVTVELSCAASSTLGHIPELIIYVHFVLQEMRRGGEVVLICKINNRGAELCVKFSFCAQIQMEQSKES